MTAQAQPIYSSQWIYACTEVTVPGVATRVALPSVEHRAAYGLRWWAGAAACLLSRHELHPRRAGRYAATFHLSNSLRHGWDELFDIARAQRPDAVYPFLHAQAAGTLLYRRILADLGVQSRHLIHLRHVVHHLAGSAALAEATEQTVDCHLLRAVRVGHNDVLLILAARISDPSGATLATVEDSFLVRQLQVPQAAQAEDDDQERRALARLARRVPEIDLWEPDVRSRMLYLAADVGRRFGRVSGHANLVHRSRLGALFAGQRRPYVQGMYLRNVIVRELAEWGLPLERLAITFVSKAWLGQTLRLTLQDRRFELCTDTGRLVAFGRA